MALAAQGTRPAAQNAEKHLKGPPERSGGLIHAADASRRGLKYTRSVRFAETLIHRELHVQRGEIGFQQEHEAEELTQAKAKPERAEMRDLRKMNLRKPHLSRSPSPRASSPSLPAWLRP